MESYSTSPGLQRMRDNWGWYLALGVGLVILGILCLVWAPAATVATVALFGIFTLLAGVVVAVSAIWAGGFWGAILRIIAGVLLVIAGFYMITRPFGTAAVLTVGIALFLIVTGIVQIVGSFMEQGRGWGWGVASGVIGVLLGILLWVGWPVTGFVAIGIFVGIDILISGVSLVVASLTARTYGLPGAGAAPMA
jgi:uncharacterized membrane protein HdeD (DUF308 family)